MKLLGDLPNNATLLGRINAEICIANTQLQPMLPSEDIPESDQFRLIIFDGKQKNPMVKILPSFKTYLEMEIDHIELHEHVEKRGAKADLISWDLEPPCMTDCNI